MTKFDPLEILKLGVIGLAFLLAFLAYAILRQEQNFSAPRRLMLTAAYVFMIFALVMTGMTIFNGIKDKVLNNDAERLRVSADAERRRGEGVPTITWTVDSVSGGTLIRCKANGNEIGAHLDCALYQTCRSLEGNRLVCAGTNYAEAIAREHSKASMRYLLDDAQNKN